MLAGFLVYISGCKAKIYEMDWIVFQWALTWALVKIDGLSVSKHYIVKLEISVDIAWIMDNF